jgi:4-hydroxy-4-methyl-2-oxoglutarate aldolase
MSIVVTKTKRTDMSLVDALGQFGVATIHEAQGQTGLLAPRLRPIYRPARISGNALTCEVNPGDNLSIHIAVEQARPGDILVVTPTSPCDDGFFGELLATSFAARGVRGLIIDAGVRDVADLTKMGFPVWSAAVNAKGTVKRNPGDVQTSIVCAGAKIRPGDVIIADDDGVVVVRRKNAAKVIESSRTREEAEEEKRAHLATGEISIDLSGVRERWTEMGVRFVEDSD